MAIGITRPVVCPHCGYDIEAYSINTNTGKYIFVCQNINCGHSMELTTKEYIRKINNPDI